MKNWNVTFEVFTSGGKKEYKKIRVVAGTKKLAAIRAMQEINKLEGYPERYKNIIEIMEAE